MERAFGSEQLPAEGEAPVVTMGNFDGVHRGHRVLIETTVAHARECGAPALLYTYDPHPVHILAPRECPPLIQTLEQRLRAIEKLGVDLCVIEPFSAVFAQLTPEAFLEEVVVKRLRAREIIVGYDFTFGLHRAGTIETLRRWGEAHGVTVQVIEAQFVDETLVSSTAIRRLIAAGEVAEAAELLGRPYAIAGRVIPGRGLGRTLAARTANIRPENELLPKSGIYTTRAKVRGRTGAKRYASITSIGTNPTFPDAPFAVETHLLDVDVDIMGEDIVIEFLRFERSQVAFASTAELREQIRRDVEGARRFHRRPEEED